MRDILLFAMILGGIPWYLTNPFYGILAFHWVSIMNPHRYTWGAAFDFPFAKLIAVVTLIGFFMKPEIRNPLPKERETALMVALLGMFTLTSFFAFFPTEAWDTWAKTAKIFVMVLVTMMLCCSKERLRWLMIVIAISLGFIGLKGGVFGMVTGGAHKVWGPPGTFIEDNNDLGLAFNIVLPIMFYLARSEEKQWQRRFLFGVFALTVLSTVLTFSRGAAVTLAAVLVLLVLRSKKKATALVLLVCVGFFASLYMTDTWTDRMDTIKEAETDSSFMGRVNAWKYSWNLALDYPLTGGGFEGRSVDLFQKYAPNPEDLHDVHNIYFEVLGEHGFPTLGLFLALFGSTLISLNRVRKRFHNDPEHGWLSEYASVLQISLFAYLLNGMTLGRAYFDLAYLIVAISIMVKTLARQVDEADALERNRIVFRKQAHDNSQIKVAPAGLKQAVDNHSMSLRDVP